MNQIAVGVVLAAAVITALGVIWKKILLPTAQAVSEVQRLLPIIREIIDEWATTTSVPSILAEIAAQFRTDGGSSLRDIINRLETAADSNVAALREVTIRAEAAKEIAALDRAQTLRLAVLIDRLSEAVNSGVATVDRIEEKDAVVAKELLDSKTRAGLVPLDSPPGSAADAAAQSAPEQEQ